MATGPGFPSATNAYIPNWEASGRLAVQYSRNPKDFPCVRWLQLVQSPKNTGYYLKLTSQEAARVVSTNDYVWAWDNTRPMRPDGLESFNFIPFATKRYNYGFNIGEDTERQAEWEIGEQHAKIHAQKAMTVRSMDAIAVLTTSTNWTTAGGTDPDLSADHTATATALSGGQFDLATTANPYLKKALDKAAVLINLDTLGVVQQKDLMVIMNPNTARLIAESAEIHDYLKGSPAALDEIRMATSPNAQYGPGLPSSVYGYPIIVENTVKVTSRKGATLAKSFAFPDQAIIMVARIGGLEGAYGTPSFSTICNFWYRDEMTLERFHDVKNRLMEYSIVDCFVPTLTSPLSGYYITAATSVAS